MRLAIVGSSRLSEVEEMDARKLIANIIKDYQKDDHIFWACGFIPQLTIISGGAKGIDTIAAQTAYGLGIPVTVYSPKTQDWPGFKERNIIISKLCDELICITTKYKTELCYHCDLAHQRSGACWTLKQAKKLNKPTKLYIL